MEKHKTLRFFQPFFTAFFALAIIFGWSFFHPQQLTTVSEADAIYELQGAGRFDSRPRGAERQIFSGHAQELGEEYEIPEAATAFKAWMDYRTLTCKSSKQYAMQQDAWTDEGGLRRYGDEGYYMVAMGTYYAEECGKVFDVTFENGTTIRCIIGDIKADVHTDEKHQHRNGNVVEFIVDKDKLGRNAKVMGDVSWSEHLDLRGEPVSIVAVPA